jgi:hypoxanthine phosphoribosyltransferase
LGLSVIRARHPSIRKEIGMKQEKEREATDPRAWLDGSAVLVSRDDVQAAVAKMAAEINAHYGERPLIVLVVLTGAMLPAAWLAPLLRMPLELDFVHVTRYDGGTEGGEIRFRVSPRLPLAGADVLVVEDIFDVGLTLQAILRFCSEEGARSARSAVLVRKIHDRGTTAGQPDFVGLEVEDKYIFGCGMDIHEHWRHLDEIRALEDSA